MVALGPKIPIWPAAGGGGGRLDDAGEGDGQSLRRFAGQDGRDGAAGGDDHFHMMAVQKAHVLCGETAQGLGAARPVRDAAGIAEIDEILLGH